jgi:hypothetical protein
MTVQDFAVCWVATSLGGALFVFLLALNWPRGICLKPGSFDALFQAQALKGRSRPFEIRQDAVAGDGGERLVWSAVSFDAMSAPLAAWEQWHSVDPHVFDAFSQMTHEPINNLADLTRTVELHHYPIADHGFLESVKGHVGEWQTNADFSALHPVMPEASNFAGLDMWLDGDHAANVKTVNDATSTLFEHFSKYPHIAAIIPFDAHHIPSDALYYSPGEHLDSSVFDHAHLTIVDTHLSNAEMFAHTQGAFDSVAHPAGDLHMPWITLAVTGFTEGRLLFSGQTSFARATVTTLGTTAAVGAGGLTGKTIGGAIGTAMLPGLGTIVGAVVGGFAGAIGGKFIVNAVKQNRMHKAFDEYEHAQRSYVRHVPIVSAYVEREWSNASVAIETQLSAEIAAIKDESESQLASVRAVAETLNNMPQESACAHVAATLRLVQSRSTEVLKWSLIPGIKWLLNKQRTELDAWASTLQTLLKSWTGSAREVALLFDLAMASPSGKRSARRYIRSFFGLKRRLYSIAAGTMNDTLKEAVTRRQEAVRASRDLWDRIDSEAKNMMRPYRSAWRQKAQDLRKELSASGAGTCAEAKTLDELLNASMQA